MSEQMVFFLSNLSWSFAAGVVVLGATVIISTIGGRLIGPYEYGQYNYILVITQFIILFAFWGLDTSAIKAIAKSTDNSNSEKQKIISS
ncbi:oligosaccharide flippase family protein, partial [Patescibacteria group bacterium]|nr:oligosaccharide flippase family protein [Patescibacteria group bacterium]